MNFCSNLLKFCWNHWEESCKILWRNPWIYFFENGVSGANPEGSLREIRESINVRIPGEISRWSGKRKSAGRICTRILENIPEGIPGKNSEEISGKIFEWIAVRMSESSWEVFMNRILEYVLKESTKQFWKEIVLVFFLK